MTYYHGGKAGLNPGDLLVPSPPHVTDGCPVCVGRATGRPVTILEYKTWLSNQGPRGRAILAQMVDFPDDEIMDPPTGRDAVYFTTVRDYAMWYAARSGHGDLYEVSPVGDIEASKEDHFTTFCAPAARVLRVLQRSVRLDRRDRRRIARAWEKADKQAMALT